MSESVRIQGPNGVYSANDLFFELMNATGMALAVHGENNVSKFFQEVLELIPDLRDSGVSDQGFLIWQRGNTKILWCMVADPSNEHQSSAIFVQGTTDIENLPRMFIEIQDSGRARGFVVDGIFGGETSPATEQRFRRSTVIPSQILLGLDWSNER